MVKDFFDNKYFTEPARSDGRIGICDPEGESPAYTTTTEKCADKRCAIISNSSHSCIQFVPIDKNIVFKDVNGNIERSCDGMLFDDKQSLLCFVELKDVRKQWISTAVAQLEQTIIRFNACHDSKLYHCRRAYACNPNHPQFAFSERQLMQEFRVKTGFRLMIQYKIVIPDLV